MKIVAVTSLALPEVKVVRFGRFPDARGYFSEIWRQSDLEGHPELAFLHRERFVQANESFSRPGTMRGLHFQWAPYVGKLIRTVHGRMVDLVVDIRHGSPTLGQGLMYDMPNAPDQPFSEWIWVPPGFAHGNFFDRDTRIEYYCTGEYNPACEAGISPLAADLDWSRADAGLKREFDAMVANGPLLVSDKDRAGFTLAQWLDDPRSQQFTFPG
jgi:dTDP-4-dehydrorhamnose 3,5-epimerase